MSQAPQPTEDMADCSLAVLVFPPWRVEVVEDEEEWLLRGVELVHDVLEHVLRVAVGTQADVQDLQKEVGRGRFTAGHPEAILRGELASDKGGVDDGERERCLAYPNGAENANVSGVVTGQPCGYFVDGCLTAMEDRPGRQV